MTHTRLGIVGLLLIFLFSVPSCTLFMKNGKPTQVVDLTPMLGKSLQEMTAMFGPPTPSGICHSWKLPEGVLSACYKSDSARKTSVAYRLTGATFFSPGIEASSLEEMAELVKIDLQGKKPDTEFHGGYAYDNLILNGQAVEVAFDGGPQRIVGVKVDIK